MPQNLTKCRVCGVFAALLSGKKLKNKKIRLLCRWGSCSNTSPEVFPPPRVVLVGAADEEDVDDEVDEDHDAGGDQVLLVRGLVVERLPKA